MVVFIVGENYIVMAVGWGEGYSLDFNFILGLGFIFGLEFNFFIFRYLRKWVIFMLSIEVYGMKFGGIYMGFEG